MRLYLYTVLLIGIFCGNIFSAQATCSTEIFFRGRSEKEIDEGCHAGSSITVHVNDDKKTLWCGEIRFRPNDGVKPWGRILYESKLSFDYDIGDDKTPSSDAYFNKFGEPPVDSIISKTSGVFIGRRLKDLDRVAGYSSSLQTGRKFGWIFRELDLSAKRMMELLEDFVKNDTISVPYYKYNGYDWSYRAHNCVSFTTLLLRELGVPIQDVVKLNEWLDPVKSKGFLQSTWNGAGYFTSNLLRLNFIGFTQSFPGGDSIKREWVIKKIKDSNLTFDWSLEGKSSSICFVDIK